MKSLFNLYPKVFLSIYLYPNLSRSFSAMYCIVLDWRGAPPNLGITRNMTIKFCSEAYFFQAWGSLSSLKSQTRDPKLKDPPGGLVLRIYTSWKKSIDLSRDWTRDLGTRGEHVTSRLQRPTTMRYKIIINNHNKHTKCVVTLQNSQSLTQSHTPAILTYLVFQPLCFSYNDMKPIIDYVSLVLITYMFLIMFIDRDGVNENKMTRTHKVVLTKSRV